MRSEYILAATLMGAALAVPAVLVGVMGNVVPGLSQDEDTGRLDDTPLTLMTPPVMIPNDQGGGRSGIRTVFAELDMPGRKSADRVCKDYPRIADRIVLHFQDPNRGPLGPRGHDARLAWSLNKALTQVEVETVAIIDSTDKNKRRHDRPVYRCNQGTAWPVKGMD